MNKRYKVTKYKREITDPHFVPLAYESSVDELINTYGLTRFTRFEVYKAWREYSEHWYCAGWLATHHPEDVERAFGVELEEE